MLAHEPQIHSMRRNHLLELFPSLTFKPHQVLFKTSSQIKPHCARVVLSDSVIKRQRNIITAEMFGQFFSSQILSAQHPPLCTRKSTFLQPSIHLLYSAEHLFSWTTLLPSLWTGHLTPFTHFLLLSKKRSSCLFYYFIDFF